LVIFAVERQGAKAKRRLFGMKEKINKINIDDYDYDLPEERIAQYPVRKRENSKLLLYNKGIISEDIFSNIPEYLPHDALMVFNNTRVIRARILFRKESGTNIEVFCLEPQSPAEYELSFGSKKPVEWKCIIGNLKKWKTGCLITEFLFKGSYYKLTAEKVCSEGEVWRIRFSWNSGDIIFGEVIESAGHIPLPPYIKREDEKADNIRYQTVYSTIKGSVAAPTAGLHFTKEVLDNIKDKGIKTVELTLHVGAGTFQPVKTNDISEHEMHCEHFFVSKEVIENLLANQRKIIAVGTTSVRTLETLFWLGVKIIRSPSESDNELITDQWEPYGQNIKTSFRESLDALLILMEKKKVTFLHGVTKIIIIPGYKFRVINGILTNFHQPKSTLLLLISAWVGPDWKKIYNFALENKFRFLSFGDSSLLLK
jgi:S-adenosylmethionine:tRNA ribosyltransferase-isomerase